MAFKKGTEQSAEIIVVNMEVCDTSFWVLGESPIVLNRVSEKAKRQLLVGSTRKNAHEKAVHLKHNPIEEFRDAPYYVKNDEAETYICHIATAFKSAIRDAAMDTGGTSKAELGRLLYVKEEYVPIWGLPSLYMAVVVQAGMSKAPDIRTRVIIPHWAARLTVRHSVPKLPVRTVQALICLAGQTQGVGDGRPGKGKNSFGRFRIVDANDPTLKKLLIEGSRVPQQQAMQNPQPYDDETRNLLDFYEQEVSRRGLKKA